MPRKSGNRFSEKDMLNTQKHTRHIVPTLTPAMLLTWALFATLPFWIEQVGLYQYLGVEILIWATYALAYNLVLGHAGLPSFGHGAFFGIGAYAFGLAQFNIAPNLWVCLLAALLA